MKNIDDYLNKLNNTIDSMQQEANFYLVIQLFNKLREFQTILKNENTQTQITLLSNNMLLCPGFWMEFDNSNEDMNEIFTKIGITTAKGINHIEEFLKLPFTLTEDMNLEQFVKNCTTEHYQKKFLAYKLEIQLPQSQHIAKKKL